MYVSCNPDDWIHNIQLWGILQVLLAVVYHSVSTAMAFFFFAFKDKSVNSDFSHYIVLNKFLFNPTKTRPLAQ